MKIKISISVIFAVLLLGIFDSCKKDKSQYTYEDQQVTGDWTFVTKSLVPTSVDPNTQQPLAAKITLDGAGSMTVMDSLRVLTSFNFDFVLGKGTDFVTTYTGVNTADSFKATTASSQRQPDGSIILTETLGNGTGKFSKIKGGGTTIVLIAADGMSGTGKVTWKVTY
jgi:hypothetical protein